MSRFTVVEMSIEKGNINNSENLEKVSVDTFPDRVIRTKSAERAANKSSFTGTKVGVFFGGDKISSETHVASFKVNKDGVAYRQLCPQSLT